MGNQASFEARFQVALGAEIQAQRQATWMSQSDIAGRLGLHVKTYATYEQGIRPVTAPRLTSIARAIGTGPDVLMRWSVPGWITRCVLRVGRRQLCAAASDKGRSPHLFHRHLRRDLGKRPVLSTRNGPHPERRGDTARGGGQSRLSGREELNRDDQV